MFRYSFFIFLIIVSFQINAQNPKKEFRAVWVSTVVNIDWPSGAELSTEKQKHEAIRILDLHKKNGANAIILQVRPSADAFYNSQLEPWSRYLTGTQGKAPKPFYDPLEFWINECHKRGMELHAWFNPYRIKQNLADSLSDSHIFNQNPSWGWEYGERVYFAPDHPEVWGFVTEVVIDVVRRYDIDAVHFDDYFYPYEIPGEEIPDEESFKERGGEFYPDHKNEWRIHNVDTIIQMLGSAIKQEKAWVKFGISPFGVWRNREMDPQGSETKAGTTNFDGLYADVIKWQRMGWIDYLMPQIYWRDDHPAAGFSTLAYWWNDFSYGRAVYIGLAPYRFNKKSEYKQWRKEKYFLRKIELTRQLEEIEGYGFFSSRHFFREDFKKINNKLQKSVADNIAVVPTMPWIDSNPPEAPHTLHIENDTLSWEIKNEVNPMDQSRFYLIYYYKDPDLLKLKRSENILCLTGERKFKIPDKIQKGYFRISSLDRSNNESQLSEILEINKK